MSEHTFSIRQNRHAEPVEVTVDVPTSPREWAKRGWNAQELALSAATVKVQAGMRDKKNLSAEFAQALFNNGGVDPEKGRVTRNITLPEAERENDVLIASLEEQGYTVEFAA